MVWVEFGKLGKHFRLRAGVWPEDRPSAFLGLSSGWPTLRETTARKDLLGWWVWELDSVVILKSFFFISVTTLVLAWVVSKCLVSTEWMDEWMKNWRTKGVHDKDITTQGSDSHPPLPQIHSIKMMEQDLHQTVKCFSLRAVVFPFAPGVPEPLSSCTSGLLHRYSHVFLLLPVFCPGLRFLHVSSGEYELHSLFLEVILRRKHRLLPKLCVGRGQDMDRRPGCVRFSRGKQELTDQQTSHPTPTPVSIELTMVLGNDH